MAYIKMTGISKIYGSDTASIKALDDISLDVNKGELVVILGQSGAGKTTLLNILGGMDSPTSGEYLFNGEDVAKYNEKKLGLFRRNDIGFVFQFYNLMPNLTALENVMMSANVAIDPLDPVEVLKSVGLENRLNNFPQSLSGGEQQRVSIARAIVKKPSLLLCDEPTGALDSKTGVSIIAILKDIAHQGNQTVIIVTHNALLSEIADRVIHINDGKITKNELNQKPKEVNEIKW